MRCRDRRCGSGGRKSRTATVFRDALFVSGRPCSASGGNGRAAYAGGRRWGWTRTRDRRCRSIMEIWGDASEGSQGPILCAVICIAVTTLPGFWRHLLLAAVFIVVCSRRRMTCLEARDQCFAVVPIIENISPSIVALRVWFLEGKVDLLPSGGLSLSDTRNFFSLAGFFRFYQICYCCLPKDCRR